VIVDADRGAPNFPLCAGNAGISRSGALLIAYIMQRHSLGYSEALRLVQLRRFCVSPNEGFQAQLMEYEPIYRAQQMAQQMQAAGGGGQVRCAGGFDMPTGLHCKLLQSLQSLHNAIVPTPPFPVSHFIRAHLHYLPVLMGTMSGLILVPQARGKRGFMAEDDEEEERNPVNFPVHHPAPPLPGHGAYVRSPAVAAGPADAGSSMEQ